jgi:Carboxypeptidase regulatory-like domain
MLFFPKESNMKKLLSLTILAIVTLFASAAQAQNAISTGSISGQVTDTSGALVLGATVTAENVAAGIKLNTKTNGAGFYTLPSLPVGAYNIAVSQAGFKTTNINDVVVQVGQNTSENVALQVGDLTQSVTIAAEAPLLRATESTVSTVVNQNLIENLPLSGRRYTDFVLLTPNVTAEKQKASFLVRMMAGLLIRFGR